MNYVMRNNPHFKVAYMTTCVAIGCKLKDFHARFRNIVKLFYCPFTEKKIFSFDEVPTYSMTLTIASMGTIIDANYIYSYGGIGRCHGDFSSACLMDQWALSSKDTTKDTRGLLYAKSQEAYTVLIIHNKRKSHRHRKDMGGSISKQNLKTSH